MQWFFIVVTLPDLIFYYFLDQIRWSICFAILSYFLSIPWSFAHSWQRGPNPSVSWRPPNPPPTQLHTHTHIHTHTHTHTHRFLSNHPFPVASNLYFLILWINGGLIPIWCIVLLNNVKDLHMSSLCTFLPEGPCYVFYVTRPQVYWGLKYMWFYAGTLFDTHTKTQDTQGSID